jgi:hypothetical protein
MTQFLQMPQKAFLESIEIFVFQRIKSLQAQYGSHVWTGEYDRYAA